MAKIVTHKDFQALVKSYLDAYKQDSGMTDSSSRDPSVAYIDGFAAAFNLDKMLSRTALRSILHVAFKGENVDINKALDRIKEHYKL